MPDPNKQIKVIYGDRAKVEKIEPWGGGGFDVWFDCFKVPLLFATCPDWNVGDTIKITFEKAET